MGQLAVCDGTGRMVEQPALYGQPLIGVPVPCHHRVLHYFLWARNSMKVSTITHLERVMLISAVCKQCACRLMQLRTPRQAVTHKACCVNFSIQKSSQSLTEYAAILDAARRKAQPQMQQHVSSSATTCKTPKSRIFCVPSTPNIQHCNRHVDCAGERNDLHPKFMPLKSACRLCRGGRGSAPG